MKTKSNVQKTITKSLAVIISLVLISITVNAQDFWKTVFENNSFNQIAMVMTNEVEASAAPASAQASTGADAYAELTALNTEETLEIENWMVDESSFFTTITVINETENSLEIEDWMTDESLFSASATYLQIDNEEALEVEEWMKDTEHFGVKTIEIEEETDAPLALENWMTSETIWNN